MEVVERRPTTESREERIEILDDRSGQGQNTEGSEKMLDPRERRQFRHTIFLICCVVAVSLDPLFFYVPFINDRKKCLGMDEKLKKTVLVLRSVMDLTYIFHIAFQIYSGYSSPPSESNESVPKSEKVIDRIMGGIQRINWTTIAIDILCVLPIPQVVILVYFPKMKGSKSLNRRKILNFILLLQFVPRIVRIYQLSKELKKNVGPRKIARAAWVKGLFNFFLYVIASHLFGASWYFFSVQRESTCWHLACRGNSMCDQSNFFCMHRNPGVNDPTIGYLSRSCPLDSPSRFDFGIFAPALRSGIVYSKDFPRKYFYCFAWGLRNLSSFGSNLETSAYFWESLFSIATTVIGLLLFVYLIGNFQTILQFSTADSEERRKKSEKKEVELDKLLERYDSPPELKKEVIALVGKKLHEIEDVNLKSVIDALPSESKNRFKKSLCHPKTGGGKVGVNIPKRSKETGNPILDAFYDHLIPITYMENACIFKKDEPLDQIIIIIQGKVKAFECDKERCKVYNLRAGQLYGQDLIEWALSPPSKLECNNFPVAREEVVALTKVEAFVLRADKFKTLIHQYLSLPRKALKDGPEYMEKLASSAVHYLQAARQRYILNRDKLSDQTHGDSGD